MLTTFAAPARYVQGQNATTHLGSVMTEVGLTGPALIVASERIGREMRAAWQQTLGEAGIPFTIHRFGGECSQSEIDSGIAAARAAAASTVIAVGGGKALDAGRAIGVAVGTRVVMCPTLASNDAPCSAVSVIYTESGEVVRVMHHARTHSVHNGLTTLAPTHEFLHGEKVAFGLLVQLAVEGRPSSEFEDVVRFCRTVGLPTRLGDIGLRHVSDDDLAQVAQRTVAPGETAHHEPFEVTPQVIIDGIRAADSWSGVIQ